MKKFTFFIFLLFITTLAAEWTILETYNIPGKASGLAWDGEYLYSGIYGVNGSDIYQIDPTDGSYQLLFSDPDLDDTYGLTYDGEYLWLTDHRDGASQPAVAYQYDFTGNILAQFTLPDHYMSGIAFDQGNFWVSTYYPDGPSIIYQVDDSGEVLSQIDYSLPGNSEQPWDLAIENGNLWVADYDDDNLHKLDPADGTILESYPSENIKPSGVVYDGTYLWYVDGELSSDATLYKVDLGGTGTPVISTDWQEYDFDFVTVGSLAEVDLQIYNNGNADLLISELQLSDPSFYHQLELPLTISAGSSQTVTLYFSPETYGSFSTELDIFSNDPINDQISINMQAYGLMPDPTLIFEPTTVEFGSIRTASSRSQLIYLSNQGNNTLDISDVVIDNEQFYLDDITDFSSAIELDSADTLQIRVWFYPTESGDYQSVADIYSNDPENPLSSLDLSGSSTAENFEQGQIIWEFQINGGYDNSVKAIKQIVDISGDDHHDLIVTSEDNYLRAFNGNSDTFADLIWELEIPGGNVYDQNSLAIVDDVDEDGYQDIIVGTSGSDRAVRAISGKSGETFFTYQTNAFGSGGTVYQIDASRDFNEDGVVDALAASGNDLDGTGPQRIFLFDGSDGTLLWDFYAAGPKFSCLALEDINADGVPDAIGGGSNLNETTGLVFAIDGSTGNQIWQFSTEGTSVWALAATEDLNEDGVADLMLGDFMGNLYALDAVDGSEIWSRNLGSCLILDLLNLGDVNGNGSSDFAVARSSIAAVDLIDSSNGETIWSTSVPDQPWNIELMNDLNDDGVPELVVGTLYNSNYGIWLSGADGELISSVNLGTPVDAIGALADITQDDSWEMVLGGRDGILKCFASGQTQTFAPETEIPDMLTADILRGNYPNPFNPTTSVLFALPQAAETKLQIFNSKGQLVKTLIDEFLPAGEHQSIWHGLDSDNNPVSSGIYLYKIESGNLQESAKMLLLK